MKVLVLSVEPQNRVFLDQIGKAIGGEVSLSEVRLFELSSPESVERAEELVREFPHYRGKLLSEYGASVRAAQVIDIG